MPLIILTASGSPSPFLACERAALALKVAPLRLRSLEGDGLEASDGDRSGVRTAQNHGRMSVGRVRQYDGSALNAAFLSARTESLANLAMIGAGLATVIQASAWPDVAVGLAILILTAGASFEVYRAARAEL
jgi:Co/Zn/Cd efflux system component